MQRQWLELIRDHIAGSLTITRQDLMSPPFTQHDGLGRAVKVFGARSDQSAPAGCRWSEPESVELTSDETRQAGRVLAAPEDVERSIGHGSCSGDFSVRQVPRGITVSFSPEAASAITIGFFRQYTKPASPLTTVLVKMTKVE